MDYKANIKYLKVGPRKMREVANVVRGKMVDEALSDLDYLKKRAAKYLAKSLRSAIAGAKNDHSAKEKLLKVKFLEVNEGPDFKRWRPVSRGMSHPYAKKTSHVRIVLTEVKSSKLTEVKPAPKKEVKPANPVEKKVAKSVQKGATKPVKKAKNINIGKVASSEAKLSSAIKSTKGRSSRG